MNEINEEIEARLVRYCELLGGYLGLLKDDRQLLDEDDPNHIEWFDAICENERETIKEYIALTVPQGLPKVIATAFAEKDIYEDELWEMQRELFNYLARTIKGGGPFARDEQRNAHQNYA
ncbi:type I restriction enzyme HsdR protein [Oceanobacillus picturae]|uniref:Type I restriction enzyme HsdR protein, partial n=1 Tax=Oceanobacillus picturae TaxID=171693 RepID=A0A0U9H7A4_9BACI|nr:hypothetical protein [Oceanobacillus picturae]GAQ18514.1 type I restriction enzyme HsdR protein [Oceanobacillus picturae]